MNTEICQILGTSAFSSLSGNVMIKQLCQNRNCFILTWLKGSAEHWGISTQKCHDTLIAQRKWWHDFWSGASNWIQLFTSIKEVRCQGKNQLWSLLTPCCCPGLEFEGLFRYLLVLPQARLAQVGTRNWNFSLTAWASIAWVAARTMQMSRIIFKLLWNVFVTWIVHLLLS